MCARAHGQLVADLGTGAEHEVEHAGRQVGLGHALGEQARAHRGGGGRGPDHAVAARQRRSQHLGGHRVGPVPGRDQPQHAERPAQQQHPPPRRGALRHDSLHALAVLRGHAKELDQLSDLALGLGLERLALVECEHARQLVGPAFALVGHAVQQLGPFVAGPGAPTSERPVGRGDGAPRVLAIAVGHRPEHLAGGRAGGLDGGAARRVAPLAVDEHPSSHVAGSGSLSGTAGEDD